MSTVKTNNVQIGQSVTATNNFTWYQPASPDGTVRLGNGNSGSVTDLVTLTSAGNLGIGTSSPAQVLDVQKAQAWVTATSTTGTNSSVFKTANTGGSSYFGRESSAGTVFGGGAYATVVYGSGAYPMSFFTNDTKQMTLDSSGNLGLGVTPSAWSLGRALEFSSGALLGYASTEMHFAANAYYASGWKYKTSGYSAGEYLVNGNTHQWYIAPSGTAGNAISFTQAMTLDASGNLLVGTTSKSSVVGVNSKFSAGLATLGNVTGGGTGAVDTGISINAGAAGGTILFLASRNVGAGTQTASAVYIITLYYDGNNAPSTTFVGGTNFCTFGVSGSNTLTVTNSGSGNASYSWFINK